MTSERPAGQAAQDAQPALEEENDQNETIDAGELEVAGYFGWVAGYFVLSGSIATFIYLRWLGIASTIASALEPLGSAAVGILGVVAMFVNLILMGLLLVNAEGVKEWFSERGML